MEGYNPFSALNKLLYYVIYRRPINRMDQSLLRKPIYSKLLALYDNYDVSKVIILFISKE